MLPVISETTIENDVAANRIIICGNSENQLQYNKM